MYLVDNIYLITTLRRRILHLINNITDVSHTIIGRRINLYDIHGCLAVDLLAHGTLVTWAAVYRRFTVYRLRHDLCHRSLTGSTGTAKQIRMTDPIRLDLIPQGRHNVILPLDLIKARWPELPI